MNSRQILAIFCIIVAVACAYFHFRPDGLVDVKYPTKLSTLEIDINFIWIFWVVACCFVLIPMTYNGEVSKIWKWLAVVSGGVIIMLIFWMNHTVGAHISLSLAIWFFIWLVVVGSESKIGRKPTRGI